MGDMMKSILLIAWVVVPQVVLAQTQSLSLARGFSLIDSRNLTSQCAANRGFMGFADKSGNMNIRPQANGQVFCVFSGSACPAPFRPYLKWSATAAGSCSISFDRGNAVNDNAWNACRNSAMVQAKCGHGNPVVTGAHKWGNLPLETKNYNSLLRVCYGGNCGDHVCYNNDIGNTSIDCSFTSGGSQALVCSSQIIQIGCH